jgi:hypothetical protein
MNKISKEKQNYSIIAWKWLHQYLMDDLVAYGDAEKCLC